MTRVEGADGNVTNRSPDVLTYDQANRLIQAVVGSTTAMYTYDGDGKRTRKVAGGQTTDYTYDVATSLPVLLEDGQRTYVWGRGLLYATNPAGTAVLSVYQRDGLGTVWALTDGAGTLTDTRDVDPFGLPTRGQGTGGQPFRFAGEQGIPGWCTRFGGGGRIMTGRRAAASPRACSWLEEGPAALSREGESRCTPAPGPRARTSPAIPFAGAHGTAAGSRLASLPHDPPPRPVPLAPPSPAGCTDAPARGYSRT